MRMATSGASIPCNVGILPAPQLPPPIALSPPFPPICPTAADQMQRHNGADWLRGLFRNDTTRPRLPGASLARDFDLADFHVRSDKPHRLVGQTSAAPPPSPSPSSSSSASLTDDQTPSTRSFLPNRPHWCRQRHGRH